MPGVNVEIAVKSGDVAALLNGASNVTVGAAAGTYTATFEVADAEYDAVVAYVKAEVAKSDKLANKEVESVETTKTVTVKGAAAGTASFNVERDVVVVLKDKETTTSTSETTDTTETTVTTATGSDTDTDTNTQTTVTTVSGSETNTGNKH